MHNAAIFQFEQLLPQYIVDMRIAHQMNWKTMQVGASLGAAILYTFGTVQDPLDERIMLEGTSGGAN